MGRMGEANGSVRPCWKGTRLSAKALHIRAQGHCWLAVAEIRLSGYGRVCFGFTYYQL